MMSKTKVLGVLLLLIFSQYAQAAEFRVVYVSGLGGREERPQFVTEINEFFESVGVDVDVENYPWDSPGVGICQYRLSGKQLDGAKEAANEEAKAFALKLAEDFEADSTPYFVVSFSMGCRVVAESLRHVPESLEGLQQAYFLGAALPKDYEVKTDNLPDGATIINYHSPKRDMVLGGYAALERTESAGAVGFDTTVDIKNLQVSCTHLHKGVCVHSDYSRMASSIGFVMLHQRGIRVPGRTKVNWRCKVGAGKTWWNNIMEFERGGKMVVLQQNSLLQRHFRAVSISGSGTRHRIAWGNNLHAILHKLGQFEEPEDNK